MAHERKEKEESGFFLGRDHELPEELKARLRRTARAEKRKAASSAPDKDAETGKRGSALKALAIVLVLAAAAVAAYALWIR